MSRKLLILLGISGLGAGVWWWYLKQRSSDAPPPGIPAGLLPGASEMPAVAVSDDGDVTVEDTIPWYGPGAWDSAGTGQAVVQGVVEDPEAREREQREACGRSFLLWWNHRYDWAYRDVQRCREQGLL